MIIGMTGTIGSSKTANVVNYLWAEHNKGKTIYANIKLEFDYIPITYEMMSEYANNEETLYNSILFIDEMHLFMDSRRSGAKGNIVLSYFLTQSRKKDVTVIWTSQFFNQVDIRLRNLTEVVGECKVVKFCKCRNDCQHIKISDVIYHIRTANGERVKRFRFILNTVYSLYNTYEVVKNILKVNNVKAK